MLLSLSRTLRQIQLVHKVERQLHASRQNLETHFIIGKKIVMIMRMSLYIALKPIFLRFMHNNFVKIPFKKICSNEVMGIVRKSNIEGWSIYCK